MPKCASGLLAKFVVRPLRSDSRRSKTTRLSHGTNPAKALPYEKPKRANLQASCKLKPIRLTCPILSTKTSELSLEQLIRVHNFDGLWNRVFHPRSIFVI